MSAFVGDNVVDEVRRHSARVDHVQDLETEDFRVVPMHQFAMLAGFNNWFPRTPGNMPTHPTHWARVNTPEQWDALVIGAPMFRLYTGNTAGGWTHGYYLVTKS